MLLKSDCLVASIGPVMPDALRKLLTMAVWLRRCLAFVAPEGLRYFLTIGPELLNFSATLSLETSAGNMISLRSEAFVLPGLAITCGMIGLNCERLIMPV